MLISLCRNVHFMVPERRTRCGEKVDTACEGLTGGATLRSVTDTNG
nr:hypothetical protein [Kibdelosporangium sp. MJ126-NF4]CTQ92369.1 hypothetical protein [Kibdelosporangium sp. MJ126-NF4]